MDTVQDILAIKGNLVHTISESTSVLNAVKRMNDLGIGCLVVTGEDEAVTGMISERDVLKRLATVNDDVAGVAVGDIMSKGVIACCCDDPIDTVRSVMKHHFVRQIPVVGDDGRMLGIVSLGDVNSYLVQTEATEINYLHDYIEGRVR